MTKDSLQIAAIKLRYRQSFPEKAAIVSQHLSAYSGDEETDLKLADTREFMHKLAGSAGMYGYDDIAAVCRLAMDNVDKADEAELITSLQRLKLLLDQ